MSVQLRTRFGSFEDPALERAFLDEYRGSALRWAAYAAFAGALLFAAFAISARLGEPHTGAMQVARAAIATYLLVVGLCLWFKRGVSLGNYNLFVGGASAIALAWAVTMPLVAVDAQGVVATMSSPGIVFGLFLHYAFLRLPLPLAASIGWALTIVGLWLMPLVHSTSEVARMAVYLSFANIFGMILCHLMECRERNLFLERRRAESARLKAHERQEKAEEADRQKTRLIAAVSHDLRQPMTAAVAYLDVLRARLQKDDLDGARVPAEKAQAALSMLSATLDHLLTAARYDSGTEALKLEHIELRGLLQDVYGACISDADKRGIRLRVRLPKDRLLLHTDYRSAHRVLSNLISNAIKFTDPRDDGRGGVLVAARMRAGHCRIDVFDTGIGIEPDQWGQIWKPYVQLNNVERDRERGLGLGLFLVKRIVEQMPDHSVDMKSRPRHGSRFTLSLPAMRLESRSTTVVPAVVPSAALDLAALHGAHVLLLEDDRDARMSIVELLGEWQVSTSTGASLRELLSNEDDSERMVDAIVCDYRLAGEMTGLEAIARLRSRLGYSPHAVLITGEPDIAPLRARAGPETTVLQKPFMPEALARPLLRAVRAARELEKG